MLHINNFLEFRPDADLAEIVMRHTEMRHTEMRHTEMRHTEMRHTEMRHTDLNQRFPNYSFLI